jgi:hypothetical protein
MLGEMVRDLRGHSDAYSSTKWTAWGPRPIVLFVVAYTIIGIVHEWAHALTAYALKVPSTLFHLYVHLDRADGTFNERAIIRVAGPLLCLGVGLVCWFAYRKAKGLGAELPLLYLAWFGSATFFGNLMSTPFVGDFSNLALAFQLPISVRYVAGFVGLLPLCGLSFLIGTELRKWAPVGVNAVSAMVGVIALPAIVGTAMAILIFLPMSSAFAVARAGESTFWIFGAVGTLISRKQPAESSRGLGWRWMDFVILLVAILVVRVMAGGIAFVP